MEQQTTLKLDEPDYLTPDRDEPLVWVEELQILANPSTLVRAIPLRRGVNIVWAPDDRGAKARTGHAAGKTLLCRLLRFLLGEPSFASATATKAIRETLPQGLIMGRVHVLGRQWTVLRPLFDGGLDGALQGEATPLTNMGSNRTASGWSAYRAALARVVAVRDPAPFSDWLETLEWISRDQRCLDGLFTWRRGRKEVGRRAGTARMLLRIPGVGSPASGTREAPSTRDDSAEFAELTTEIRVLEAQLQHEGEPEVTTLRALDEPVLRAILQRRVAELTEPPEKPQVLLECERSLRLSRAERTNLAEQAAAARAYVKHLQTEVDRHRDRLVEIEGHRDDVQEAAIAHCSRCRQRLRDPADVAAHRASLDEEEAAAQDALKTARRAQATE